MSQKASPSTRQTRSGFCYEEVTTRLKGDQRGAQEPPEVYISTDGFANGFE